MLYLLLALSLSSSAAARKPVIPRIEGKRECTLLKNSDWGCAENTGQPPERFTYEVTKNEIAISEPACKGRRLRHAFHFLDEKCPLAAIDPEMGQPGVVQVLVKLGCTGHYRCKDLR